MKLRLISEEFYLDHNKTTIDVVEAENGVPLITAYVAEMDNNNKLRSLDVVKCVVNNELYDSNLDYAIDAFKLLFKNPSFKDKIIRFDGDDHIVDTLVAERLLVGVDGGFVLGGGNSKSDDIDMGGVYRVTNIKNVNTKINSKQDLVKAVAYHAANYGGKRWPELERLFTQRAEAFVGGTGYYVKPRLSLYKYLNNISERWANGEDLANAALRKHLPIFVDKVHRCFDTLNLQRFLSSENRNYSSISNIGKYFTINDDVLNFIDKNDEAQRIVSRLGLRIYQAISGGLIYLKRDVNENDESAKALFSDIMNGWIGRVIEITKKFYKVPDLNSLVNFDSDKLRNFCIRITNMLYKLKRNQS